MPVCCILRCKAGAGDADGKANKVRKINGRVLHPGDIFRFSLLKFSDAIRVLYRKPTVDMRLVPEEWRADVQDSHGNGRGGSTKRRHRETHQQTHNFGPWLLRRNRRRSLHRNPTEALRQQGIHVFALSVRTRDVSYAQECLIKMECLGEPRLFGLELCNEGAFCRRCERWGLRVEAFDGCSGALEQDVFTPQGRRRPAASSNPKPTTTSRSTYSRAPLACLRLGL